MAGKGRITVTNVANVGTIQSTHQYKVTVKFEIAFDYGGWNSSGASYTINCDGQKKSGTATFSVASGGGTFKWTTINTTTFTITMPTSGQSKTINLSAGINTGISPSYISASGSYTLPAVTWKWTVSYNANGGSGAPSSQTKTYGTNLTLSSTKPTRTGYTFLGWSTNKSATTATYSAGGTYTANAGATLYAIWKINTYTISYNANGGSGAPSSQTKTYGTNLTLSSTIPTRTNYNFKGWSTSNTATTATYSAGGTYTANSGATLYAVWELAYWKPKITNVSVDRCDANEWLNSYGTNAKVTFNWECCQITGENNVSSILIQHALPTSTNYVDTPVTASGISGSVAEVIGSNQLSTEEQYTIKITVTDTKGGTTPATITLSGSAYTIDFLSGGKGVALGKPAETEDMFDVNFQAKFRKSLYDQFDTKIQNGLAEYTGAGDNSIDPDFTLDELVLTDKNVPVNGFAYVRTMFYADKTTSNRRSQVAIPYSEPSSIYHRCFINGSWSNWKRPVNADDPNIVLWSGTGYYMSASHTAPLSKPISAQRNGIVLVWSYFNSGTGSSENNNFNFHFIPKHFVTAHSSNGASFFMASSTLNYVALKYCYIHDSKIVGNNLNSEAGTITTDSGIKKVPRSFVLRYVIGV